MTVTAPPRQLLVDAAPVRTPAPYGLFSVVTPRQPGDPHWQTGVEWEADPCGSLHGIGEPSCDPDTPTRGLPKQFGEDGDSMGSGEASPFTVYAPYECSPVGRGPADAQALANRRLQTREENRVERALWTGDLGNEPNLGGSDDQPADQLGSGLSPIAALAALEQYAAEQYGTLGVIHVSRAGATVWSQLGALRSSGNRLTTPLGTPVVAGSGYLTGQPGTDADAAAGTVWAAVTPGLLAYRGDVFTSSNRAGDLLDRATNDLYAIAERTYLVGWDPCGIGQASFTLGTGVAA